VTSRLGSVDAKTSTFDHTEEEQDRGFTISLAHAWLEWKKHKINVLDTPGDLNFLTDSRNAMTVSDIGVFAVSALGSVGVGTEKLWENANSLNLPRIIAITKLDRERTSVSAIMDDLRESFPNDPIAAMHLPIGSEANFEGVVDLLNQRAYRYAKDGSGKVEVGDIPGDMADEVESAREALVERVAETDDDLLEKYFEELELSQEDLEKGFSDAVRAGKLIPVVCTASTGLIGIKNLLNLIIEHGPSPLDRADIPAFEKEDGVSVAPSADGSGTALVFKTTISRSGKFSMFRVFSGAFDSNTAYFNSSQDSGERLGSLMQFQGKNQSALDKAVTGDIASVAKLKVTGTGDTLCSTGSNVRFDLINPPTPLISFAVKSESEDKVVQALQKLAEEDSALLLERQQQTNEILLRGQGQIHVEVITGKLRKQFKLEVELQPPQIAYKETIRGTANSVEGKHKKQSGGRGQFGVCIIDMRPSAQGDGFIFENAIVGGSIPRQYIPAVEKGVVEAAARGFLAGFPTVDFTVKLHDGKFHDVDSSEQAFKMAGIYAFRNAVEQCRPVILEPYMTLEVTVNAEYQGMIQGDLNSRRGRLEGTDYRGKRVTIKAKVPQAEILTYANQLTSMTEGRGLFSVEFSHYEQAPPMIQNKIVERAKAAAD